MGNEAMPKIVDASKLIPPRDTHYEAWQQFLAETFGAGHRYNTKDQSPAARANYFLSMYDKGAALMVRTVKDHSSALACARGLDACAKKLEKFFPKLLQADGDQIP